MLKHFFTFLFLLPLSCFAQHSVKFILTNFPSDTGDSVFIVGSFNRWNPADKKYLLNRDANGYSLFVSLEKGSYEFKLTKGGWAKVETDDAGKEISNRSMVITSDTVIKIEVEGWRNGSAIQQRVSTANKHVQVIDTAFYIPQLNRYRRIWIYLPASYKESHKRYPVLYMHDGQNLFEDLTSFSGEWGVDEAIDSLGLKYRECIVVGIDNGGDKRINEYSPYDFKTSSNNIINKEGDKYVDFLVHTLKQFIDKKYRTLRKKENTFIAGSSMGGLISMYAVLKYPKKFGSVGVFSPSFWMSSKIFDEMKSKGKKVRSKIYFYAGYAESETMVPLTIRAFNEMHRVSRSKMAMVLRSEGKHNEARWRIEFPLFYEWLMK